MEKKMSISMLTYYAYIVAPLMPREPKPPTIAVDIGDDVVIVLEMI